MRKHGYRLSVPIRRGYSSREPRSLFEAFQQATAPRAKVRRHRTASRSAADQRMMAVRSNESTPALEARFTIYSHDITSQPAKRRGDEDGAGSVGRGWRGHKIDHYSQLQVVLPVVSGRQR